jgi:hypothetical protein
MLSSSWNNSFTLWFVLADVSMKLHPQHEASHSPSVVATCWINNFRLLRFQFLMAVSMKVAVIWVVPCSLLEVYRHFSGGHRHLQNISKLLLDYMAQHFKRQPPSSFKLNFWNNWIFWSSVNWAFFKYLLFLF